MPDLRNKRAARLFFCLQEEYYAINSFLILKYLKINSFRFVLPAEADVSNQQFIDYLNNKPCNKYVFNICEYALNILAGTYIRKALDNKTEILAILKDAIARAKGSDKKDLEEMQNLTIQTIEMVENGQDNEVPEALSNECIGLKSYTSIIITYLSKVFMATGVLKFNNAISG